MRREKREKIEEKGENEKRRRVKGGGEGEEITEGEKHRGECRRREEGEELIKRGKREVWSRVLV